jgi:hypothetical protein
MYIPKINLLFFYYKILKNVIFVIFTLALILQLKYCYKTHEISMAVDFINTVSRNSLLAEELLFHKHSPVPFIDYYRKSQFHQFYKE